MPKRVLIITQSLGSEVKNQRALAEFDYEVLVTKLFLTESMFDYHFFVEQFDVLLLSEHLLEHRALELAEEWDQINVSAPVVLLSRKEITEDFNEKCESMNVLPLSTEKLTIYQLITEFETALQMVEEQRPKTTFSDRASTYQRQDLTEVPVFLSKKESVLYNLLLENRGTPLSTETIFREVWGEKDCKDKKIHVAMLVRRLRGKMEDDPKAPKYVRNVYNSGYLLTGDWLNRKNIKI